MAVLDQIPFGMDAGASSFTLTESVSITNRADKIETVGQDGDVKSVSYYNFNGEYTATGLKTTAPLAVGDLITAGATMGSDSAADIAAGGTGAGGVTASGVGAVGAAVIITEVTLEMSNEDFQRFTIKGNFYQGINS
mgnify:CR=1 FL=1|jgi:hypothetical protein|tara:strand:+ start:404 stop:814 length:411 start_codon:yes stop_codon:yes gene_type:complete